MNGFEHYSLNRWTEEGLSFHPRTTPPPPNQLRKFRGYIANLTVPALAVAMFGISSPTISVATALVAQGGVSLSLRAEPAMLLRTTSLVSASPSAFSFHADQTMLRSGVEVFEEQAKALLAELSSDSPIGISAETRRLAEEATRRHAETDPSGRPNWVQGVADSVARLDD